MEINLSGMSFPTQLMGLGMFFMVALLGFIGKRVTASLDRVTNSVEHLNQNMAVMFSRADSLERRLERLENHPS